MTHQAPRSAAPPTKNNQSWCRSTSRTAPLSGHSSSPAARRRNPTPSRSSLLQAGDFPYAASQTQLTTTIAPAASQPAVDRACSLPSPTDRHIARITSQTTVWLDEAPPFPGRGSLSNFASRHRAPSRSPFKHRFHRKPLLKVEEATGCLPIMASQMADVAMNLLRTSSPESSNKQPSRHAR